MKLNLHITLTVLSGVSLAGLLTGCPMPTKEGISRSATEYNLVAEKAGNEMLLLNIVRASKRRPMYFTSFGKLTGQMTFEVGTGSINIPFGSIGDGLNGSNSIAPSAGYKYSPLFDVAVLDTKEFTRGIMTPVPMKTIEYYWSQGWPKEILLHLFIRRIEIIDPNAPNGKDVYLNYPGNQEEFKKFQEYIQAKDWKWDIKPVNTTSIKEMDMTEALKLQNLSEVRKAGLTLTAKGKNKIELGLSQMTYDFKREPIKPDETTQKNEPNEPTQEAALDEITSEKKPYQNSRIIQFSTHDSSTDETDNEKWGKVYLRSPEAILYYLGEILRAENRTACSYIPKIYAGYGERKADEARLFYACKATDNDKAPCVSVDYEGTKYVIPGDPDSYDGYCTDHSMHVLSLVSQLIGLQKKSEEIPATGVVSVIGR